MPKAQTYRFDCEHCGKRTATTTLRIRDAYEQRLCAGCGATYRELFPGAVEEVGKGR